MIPGRSSTLFGQAVILLLIQVGGLGFMTVSILFAFLMRRRIGLHQRAVLMDTVGALQVGGVVRLTRRALLVTAACEGVGALVLMAWFCPRYGLARGIWMGLFHAVSAFCNAGFDLLGTRFFFDLHSRSGGAQRGIDGLNHLRRFGLSGVG